MYGYEPKITSIKGKQVTVCETCHREIKLLIRDEDDPISFKSTNRCIGVHKQGTKLEPCYYCHLQRHHVNLPPEKVS